MFSFLLYPRQKNIHEFILFSTFHDDKGTTKASRVHMSINKKKNDEFCCVWNGVEEYTNQHMECKEVWSNLARASKSVLVNEKPGKAMEAELLRKKKYLSEKSTMCNFSCLLFIIKRHEIQEH